MKLINKIIDWFNRGLDHHNEIADAMTHRAAIILSRGGDYTNWDKLSQEEQNGWVEMYRDKEAQR